MAHHLTQSSAPANTDSRYSGGVQLSDEIIGSCLPDQNRHKIDVVGRGYDACMMQGKVGYELLFKFDARSQPGVQRDRHQPRPARFGDDLVDPQSIGGVCLGDFTLSAAFHEVLPDHTHLHSLVSVNS